MGEVLTKKEHGVKILTGFSLLLLLASCGEAESDSPTTNNPYNSTQPSKDCDTSAVNYAQVKTIVTNNCVICHNENMLAGDLDLDSYSTLTQAIKNNNLQEAINHKSSLPMPPTSKLDDCSLAVFNQWILLGMPKD